MDIPVQVRLGLSGPVASIGRIRLDPNAVRAGAGQYGSYYVLEMGRHYEQYVVTGYLPSLPMVHGITTAHPFVQATKKTRAASVTGNIGEVIAALTVRRKLTTVVRHIRHINTSRKYRTPDYLMRFDPMLPSEFALVLPAGIIAAFPDWPVEWKASKTVGGTDRATLKALIQLGAYWFYQEPYNASGVGFGMIVTLTYQVPRLICITLCVPSNQAALLASIRQHRTNRSYRQYLTELDTPGSTVRGFLHNV